jgi:Rrf2 family protein
LLNLSKKMEYALIALTHLAKAEGVRAVSAKELAEAYEIPSELLAKVMQRLAKAELVTSTAGPTGGYRLARTAEQIRISAIIEAIEGTQAALVPCLRTNHADCDHSDRCTIQKPLTRLNARIAEMLHRVTLAEICRDAGETTPIQLTTKRERTQLAPTY